MRTPNMSGDSPILDVRGLSIAFQSRRGEVAAVQDVNITVHAGETLALVGESGSGKSVTGLAIMGLIQMPPGRIVSGQALWTGRDGKIVDLFKLSAAEHRKLRGSDIGMIFQEPMTSLNPVMRIGDQVAEAIRLHQGKSRRIALDDAAAMLAMVGIPDPARRLADYPHQLSGGMRQRVMIATALSCRPRLLIADEPTTALDVTIQAQILDLIAGLQRELGMAVLFVTHDLGVVASTADRVAVMYSGKIVEDAPAKMALEAPTHPYMRGLLRSAPRLDMDSSHTLEAIPGNMPDPRRPPSGCNFHPRCNYAKSGLCETTDPIRQEVAPDHWVRCARATELPAWTA
jgi:oligopeptide transport system ATP-binding protein